MHCQQSEAELRGAVSVPIGIREGVAVAYE